VEKTSFEGHILIIVSQGDDSIYEALLKKQITWTALLFCAISARMSSAQTWTPVQGVPNIGANDPLLLTDGTVMMQNASSTDWYKLTPDKKGNYAAGTWTKLASTTKWAPLYFASQVMSNGRVFAMGGEYNYGNGVWDNQGAVYDPDADTWTTVLAPSGWTHMGDTASVNLPNGLVFVADPLSSQIAAFNPSTNSFQMPYGQSSLFYDNEAGVTLMPNGNIFLVDCWDAQQAETFNTSTLQWSMLPKMPYNVVDLKDAEIGPALVMYNGKIFQFGGNGSNVIYDPVQNVWIPAPSFPTVAAGQLDCADAPAVVLPNGQIMVDAGPGYGDGGSYFFLFDGTNLNPIAAPPGAANNVDFAGNFLTLPNGQVMFTDFSNDIELYTPAGSPNAAWAPTITTVPNQLKQGSSYTIQGTQFNGLTGGSAYGDDEQNETNYPIIKITMNQTGDVFYVKEYNPSTMAICTGSQIVSTHFSMPLNIELGPATIQVVTNGIPSAPVAVSILPPLSAYAVSVYPGQGVNPTTSNQTAALADIAGIDGKTFGATSETYSTLGQVCSIEADFKVGSGITSIKALAVAAAHVSVTEQLFLYDNVLKTFVQVASGGFGTGQTSINGSPTTAASRFVGPTGEVRVLVRGVLPSHISTASFNMSLDFVGLQFG
jgi:hypothetical protein